MWQCKSELTDTVSLTLVERAEHLAASTDLSYYFLTLLLGMPAAVRSGILRHFVAGVAQYHRNSAV